MHSTSHTAAALDALVERADHDGVACLTFRNPPVNAINSAVRRALDLSLSALEHDDAVLGAVIRGAGPLFSGGGDLRELGQPEPAGAPTMSALARRIETFAKPVAVAMRGKAIGGGVLLAMACHARIASRDASFMLPEVHLGFCPGAGGTQRLPRLVGVEAAMKMAALAQALDAQEAHAQGFIDELVEEEQGLLDATVRRVHAIASGEAAWRRTASLAVPEPASGEPADAIASRHRILATRAFPGREAPQAAIELILAAAEPGADFDTGMRREKAEFDRLSASPEAKALLEHFFAERAGRRAPSHVR